MYQHMLQLRVPHCYTNISMSKQIPELRWMKTKGKRETGRAFARMTPANKIINRDKQKKTNKSRPSILNQDSKQRSTNKDRTHS